MLNELAEVNNDRHESLCEPRCRHRRRLTGHVDEERLQPRRRTVIRVAADADDGDIVPVSTVAARTVAHATDRAVERAAVRLRKESSSAPPKVYESRGRVRSAYCRASSRILLGDLPKGGRIFLKVPPHPGSLRRRSHGLPGLPPSRPRLRLVCTNKLKSVYWLTSALREDLLRTQDEARRAHTVLRRLARAAPDLLKVRSRARRSDHRLV
jgi:hypothetical protein